MGLELPSGAGGGADGRGPAGRGEPGQFDPAGRLAKVAGSPDPGGASLPPSGARSTSMHQFHTWEEAARVLGMNAEELKSKAQSREVRAFLDGGSWRFRVVDIDELARRRGLGSDAELHLSDLDSPAGSSD